MAFALEAPPGAMPLESTLPANRSLTILATIAVIWLLHCGEPFFVPLLVALLLSYALAPLVGFLTVVVRFRVLSAAIVVFSIVGLSGFAVWAWSDDIENVWQKLPVAAKMMSASVQKMATRPGNPMGEVQKAASEVESLGRTTPNAPPARAAPPPPPQPVPVWQVLWKGWKSVMTGATQVMVVLFMVFFMLASGDLFKRKLLAVAGDRLSEKKDALRVIDEIDRQVHAYLGVLLISNILVGLGTWAAFSLIGLEYAGLWGLAAGVLHTAPYFGPALVAGASLVAAFLQFNDWSTAFMVAGATIAVATVVGMVFATWLASRTSDMNATAAFVGLLFFGWIWGFWGVLLAIPILAIVKTIADRNEDMKAVSELLGS
ncbi:MAG TPA: AI-2E family transporter [Opitutaceae bacterium]|nr:AI-2E family transporter [Opitutaceae bacterium]